MRILAIDLGTSSVKLMRMDEHARVLSIDRAPGTDLSVGRWIGILKANLEAHGDGEELDGLAISGQMHGLITRENGSIWEKGIPWHDNRSAPLIPEIQKRIGPDAVTATGGPLAPGFLAASLAWVQKHEPERWAQITSVHLPKDAFVHELTGQHVTEPSDAAGSGMFSPETDDWAWPIVNELGIPHEWLPRIMPSGSVGGGLRPEYATTLGLPDGLPVILAGGDAPAGAYGAGVVRDTDALVMLSTGAQVILPTRMWAPESDGRWYTWPSVALQGRGQARYLKVGTLLNAGNVTAWAESVLAGGEISTRPSDLIALPHLIGTREDPARSGLIVGLTNRTSAREIHRALVEGIAFSVRAKLEELIGEGMPPSRIRLGGGLAHRPDMLHLFADVLGTPIEPVTQPDLSAYGAGLLAIHTLTGRRPDEVNRDSAVTEPQTGDPYHASYQLYRDLDSAMSPFTTRISALRGHPA